MIVYVSPPPHPHKHLKRCTYEFEQIARFKAAFVVPVMPSTVVYYHQVFRQFDRLSRHCMSTH